MDRADARDGTDAQATKRLARRFAEDPAFELVAYVDCHAHTSSRRSFLFCNPPEDASDFEAWERAAALPRLIDARRRRFRVFAGAV